MKSILLSVRPEWTKKILNGEKTIEIRKTAPKCKLPAIVYIYETGGAGVVGEFTLNEVDEFFLKGSGIKIKYSCRLRFQDDSLEKITCLPYDRLKSYLGDKKGYAWFIDDIRIYDKPKPLDSNRFLFHTQCKCYETGCNDGNCPYYQEPSYEYGEIDFDCEGHKPLTKAPQSWCYVEELEK